MKTRHNIMGMSFLFIAGSLVLTSCKKDTSTSATSTVTPSQQAVQMQNSDAQDAIADKTEEDIDNKLDELQNNNYAITSSKSASTGLTDTVVITVTPSDSITFPKTISLHYYSFVDSNANETLIKNGIISVTINRTDTKNPRLISRAFSFIGFSITTDSTTVSLNGTRTVSSTKNILNTKGFVSATDSITDIISANLKYAIKTIGTKNDSLTFTRIVNKTRTAITNYKNVNFKAGEPVYNLKHLHFVHVPSLDELTYTGAVTGTNEKNESYAKTIVDKLIIKNYKGSLVITSGSLTYTVGTTVSYLITFSADPNHPHLTLVTAKNNNTGTTKTFDRKLGGVFKKWW